MHEEIRHPDGRIEHPAVRYEKTDASWPAIATILVTAMVLGILVHVVVFQFFGNYGARLAEQRKSPFPLQPAPNDALPPEPRLEQLNRLGGNDISDVRARQAAKEAILRSYGRTEDTGYVHIPIDRAIDLLADKLPVRKEGAAAVRHDLGLVGAGEPNSGRLFRKEPP